MSAHASIRTGYSLRILFISLAMFAGGLWFGYDGMIGYPHKQRIYETYEQLRAEHPEQWQREWSRVSEERGWPQEVPEPYTDGQIMTQRIFAAVLLPLGALVGVMYLRLRRQWIASDATGLHTSWGQHAPWSAIRAVDKAHWQRKGIARVQYDDETGARRQIRLDDWKYDTRATEQLLAEVEAHLARDETQTQPQQPQQPQPDQHDEPTLPLQAPKDSTQASDESSSSSSST